MDAKDTWVYIKSRHVRLKKTINEDEKIILAAFIKQQKTNGIYLLSCGDLEDYLPQGYRSKDTQKLIELVSSEDFWDKLDFDLRNELEHSRSRRPRTSGTYTICVLPAFDLSSAWATASLRLSISPLPKLGAPSISFHRMVFLQKCRQLRHLSFLIRRHVGRVVREGDHSSPFRFSVI